MCPNFCIEGQSFLGTGMQICWVSAALRGNIITQMLAYYFPAKTAKNDVLIDEEKMACTLEIKKKQKINTHYQAKLVKGQW